MKEDTTKDEIIVETHVDPEEETTIVVHLSSREHLIRRRLVRSTELDIVMRNVAKIRRISQKRKPGGRNANNANNAIKVTIRISILKVWMNAI